MCSKVRIAFMSPTLELNSYVFRIDETFKIHKYTFHSCWAMVREIWHFKWFRFSYFERMDEKDFRMLMICYFLNYMNTAFNCFRFYSILFRPPKKPLWRHSCDSYSNSRDLFEVYFEEKDKSRTAKNCKTM